LGVFANEKPDKAGLTCTVRALSLRADESLLLNWPRLVLRDEITEAKKYSPRFGRNEAGVFVWYKREERSLLDGSLRLTAAEPEYTFMWDFLDREKGLKEKTIYCLKIEAANGGTSACTRPIIVKTKMGKSKKEDSKEGPVPAPAPPLQAPSLPTPPAPLPIKVTRKKRKTKPDPAPAPPQPAPVLPSPPVPEPRSAYAPSLSFVLARSTSRRVVAGELGKREKEFLKLGMASFAPIWNDDSGILRLVLLLRDSAADGDSSDLVKLVLEVFPDAKLEYQGSRSRSDLAVSSLPAPLHAPPRHPSWQSTASVAKRVKVSPPLTPLGES
jgi:hypothetical protein